MRTRGADEDLVVVDLDDPDDVASRGPVAQRQQFEDRYAELPFGLGTVARRLEPEPWYLRPGVLLWIAIALIGLLAIAGSDDDENSSTERSFPATLPTLETPTSSRLAFHHVGSWFVLDVDRRSLRESGPPDLPPSKVGTVLRAEPTQFEGFGGPLVVKTPIRDIVIAPNGVAFATGRHLVVWRRTRCGGACPIRATDMRTNRSREVASYEGAAEPIAATVSPDDGTIAIVEYNGRTPFRVRTFDARGRRLAAFELGSSTPMLVWSTDSRWLFAATNVDLVAIDTRSGKAARVDVTLPPFESWYAARS